MGFNRENYKRIKEEYDGKYLRAQEAANLRRAEVHAALPEIEKIDRELSSTGFKIFDATLRGDSARLSEISRENLELQKKRAEIMELAGFAPDYTEVKYECPLCGDTGVVEYSMCKCMRKKLVEAGIETSGMGDLIRRQNFSNFSLDYYKYSAESFRRMNTIYNYLKEYARDFEASRSESLGFFGGTGLGKTHLSSAVASAVIEKGNDVYYTSAMNMFADFEQKRFGTSVSSDVTGDIQQYFTCDLLIIDDLGTEVINQFTVSCLYNIINTRLNRKKPTILSSNMSKEDFKKKYCDRIASRVFGEYVILPFIGQDIREINLKK